MSEPIDEFKELSEKACAFLDGFIESAGLEAEANATGVEGDNLLFAVTGPDSGLLVGSHGSTLDALQLLLQLSVNKGQNTRTRLIVDADHYRERRTKTLIKFAEDLAAQVVANGEEAITDPLNAHDRRIIHSALVDNPGVSTYSEGDDPNRYVVISPKAAE